MKYQKYWMWISYAVLIVSSFFLSARSWAQDDNWDQNPDPPSRVARMNFAQGSVSFQPGGEGDWVEAVPNRPLIAGDNLWTDRDSRAELHVGSTAIRLGSESSLTFLALDDQTLQLRVAQGTVIVRMLHMDDDDLVEIDTPNVAFQVTRAGEFRVDVQPDGETTILEDIHGRGEAISGGNNYTLVAGQQARFTGDEQISYDIDSLPSPDGFDRWSFDLDRREDESASANYVSREMTGYEDLDDNGTWSFAGGYGPVWYPTSIPGGWAPYRYGHWAFIAPWGWTWVDDMSWGFAPFHYGRWAIISGRWGWVPGPVAVHPVYAPALVAFVGGGGFQLSAGGPGVAWFPLGPGEVFVPAYHVSPRYVTQVNVTNTVVNVTRVTNIYNYYTTNNTTVINRVTYVNQAAPNAVTAVSRDTFINARPVARNVVAVQPNIAQASVTHTVAIEPIRASVVGSGKPTVVAPPARVINRQVVAQRIPPPPPVPFAQRQNKLVSQPASPTARPANVRPEQPIRPGQETNRPAMNQPAATPAQPAVRPEYQAQRPVPQQAPPQPVTQQQSRPEPVRPAPVEQARPQPAQPSRPAMQEQSARAAEPENETHPQPQWSHPQAKPAPVVQPKSEQQTRDEEAKFQNWQQKQKPVPPAPKPEEKKQEEKKK